MKKIIWTYWHQGIENAPPVVKYSYNQWKKLNPEWDVIFVDGTNIHEYIEPLEIKKEKLDKISLAVSSDLYKLKLVLTHGGVFADATTYPLVPLDNWLFEVMSEGFFFFHKPGRNRLISIWFVAGYKDNIVLKKHYNALIGYWNKNSFINDPRSEYMRIIYKLTDRNMEFTRLWFTFLYRKIFKITPYLVTTYSFYNTLRKNKELMESFEKMPKIDAKKSNYFTDTSRFNLPLTEEFKNIVDNKKANLLKLNWRHVPEFPEKGTNIDYLLNKKQ